MIGWSIGKKGYEMRKPFILIKETWRAFIPSQETKRAFILIKETWREFISNQETKRAFIPIKGIYSSNVDLRLYPIIMNH